MISRPKGWTYIAGVETQTLISPAGADVAAVRYTEKVRPLRRLGDIVDGWLRAHPEITRPSIGEPERLVTAEGEWAALVLIDGDFRGNPAQVTLGVVFADDYYARIEGFALQRDQHPVVTGLVRDLTVNDFHILGSRRRRYPYTSPDGWKPIVRNTTTDWLSPSFPLEWGLIVAYAAIPVAATSEVSLELLASRAAERGFTAEGDAVQSEVYNDNGIRGLLTEMIGQQGENRMLRALVTLTDDAHLYPAELMSRAEDAWPAHKDAFTAMWKSIEPIPKTPAVSAGEMFEFWVD